jgi:hypothetical protein
MNTEECLLSRVEDRTWYRSPDWANQCCICLQQIERGEAMAQAGPGQYVHEKCFSAFYED